LEIEILSGAFVADKVTLSRADSAVKYCNPLELKRRAFEIGGIFAFNSKSSNVNKEL